MKARISIATVLTAIVLMATGCANSGAGPQGGEKDVTPPKYMGSTPTPNQTNVKDKKMVITFDEYVQLKDPYKQVIVSPPQKTNPSISSLGKKVTVELIDTMLENTTYIVDFGDAIADNNEGNLLKGYTLSFSTGDQIDSMQISGNVIDAHTLAPVEGVFVGAYKEEADSMLKTQPFEHIARTDADGRFSIKGLKKQNYRVYALKDENSNYKFDQKSELIGVQRGMLDPQRVEVICHDTIYKDSIGADSVKIKTTVIDTIKERHTFKFVPDSLLIRLYQEEIHNQYYKNCKREDSKKIVLNMVNDKKEAPVLRFTDNSQYIANLPGGNQLTEEVKKMLPKDWYEIEKSFTGDTIIYWIKDTVVAILDTLPVEISYEKTDSAGIFIPKLDTVNLFVANKKKASKKNKDEVPELDITRTVEIYNQPVLTWKKPLIDFKKEQMKVERKQDSTWTEVPYELQSTENPRIFKLDLEMENADYRVKIDSGAVTDLYGKSNMKAITKTFKKKRPEEYTSLYLKISGVSGNAFVELLNGKERIVKTVTMTGNSVKFDQLAPGEYYVRLTEDSNNDGKWTTGNFDEQKDPEKVYYCNMKFQLRANWDREEEWNIHAKPILEQRPTDLNTKTKKK